MDGKLISRWSCVQPKHRYTDIIFLKCLSRSYILFLNIWCCSSCRYTLGIAYSIMQKSGASLSVSTYLALVYVDIDGDANFEYNLVTIPQYVIYVCPTDCNWVSTLLSLGSIDFKRSENQDYRYKKKTLCGPGDDITDGIIVSRLVNERVRFYTVYSTYRFVFYMC